MAFFPSSYQQPQRSRSSFGPDYGIMGTQRNQQGYGQMASAAGFNQQSQQSQQPQRQQPTYTPPAANQQFNDFMNEYRTREWGNWNDPREQAGNIARAQNYYLPLMQGYQNERVQNFNENSWQANFGEQQYLNRNQVDLDWAASGREDRGLDYAIRSGDQNFAEGRRQFDVNAKHNLYGLDTQRYQAEMLAAHQQGQLKLGEFSNQTDRLRVGIEGNYQAGLLDNQKTQIGNEFAVAQEQNRIDALYKQGLISVEEKNAATAALRARNEFALGREANQNQKYATEVERELGLGRIGVDTFNANTARSQMQNEFAVAQEQNRIDSLYKQGLISVEQKNAATAELRARNEFALGREEIAAGRYRTDAEKLVGMANVDASRYRADAEKAVGMADVGARRYQSDIERQLGMRGLDIEQQLGLQRNATDQFSAVTGRQQVQNQFQVAQQQLALDKMVQTGRLSIDQYQAATSRLQQQSQQQEWQQQLAAQQSQFGQQLALERERMRNDLVMQRMNSFGRAAAPNMAAWSRSWA